MNQGTEASTQTWKGVHHKPHQSAPLQRQLLPAPSDVHLTPLRVSTLNAAHSTNPGQYPNELMIP